MNEKQRARSVTTLAVDDLIAHPVWRFTNDEEIDETYVVPVHPLPVKELGGMVVGTQVTLANGARVWAMRGNVKTRNPKKTEQVITLGVERRGQWFHLARYFDVGYPSRGPDELASFLELDVDDVFPVAYDIRSLAIGESESLANVIHKEPRERLTRDQIFAL